MEDAEAALRRKYELIRQKQNATRDNENSAAVQKARIEAAKKILKSSEAKSTKEKSTGFKRPQLKKLSTESDTKDSSSPPSPKDNQSSNNSNASKRQRTEGSDLQQSNGGPSTEKSSSTGGLSSSLKGTKESGGKEGCTIWIGNLDMKLSESDLRKVFSKFGTIEYLAVRSKTGHNVGYAFIGYSSAEEAREAFDASNGVCIGAHKVKVAFKQDSNTLLKEPGHTKMDQTMISTSLKEHGRRRIDLDQRKADEDMDYEFLGTSTSSLKAMPRVPLRRPPDKPPPLKKSVAPIAPILPSPYDPLPPTSSSMSGAVDLPDDSLQKENPLDQSLDEGEIPDEEEEEDDGEIHQQRAGSEIHHRRERDSEIDRQHIYIPGQPVVPPPVQSWPQPRPPLPSQPP
eukprot:CAMPEP_0184353268 /NCGR_PEP_ID=MMETSP1089-20130417/76862_1 /TAXON_ID=38269 ORGANISM="Gloeochaete wittrockiana, Strain SAG46.84" /NCGR_SAMPLE_ID=MMETSP1089 /ASSEMBLY_ACC=CAM_ASM_000445 /LENGTH=398 /DNA_ID=CAMNT_0026688519 /DNA_START=18 /DNA_END=1210 /DNA_ORIENTATION=+